MPNPSPAAQAIRAAVQAEFDRSPAPPTLDELIAAGFRALADQVVPHSAARTDRAAQRRKIRAEILGVAAELYTPLETTNG